MRPKKANGLTTPHSQPAQDLQNNTSAVDFAIVNGQSKDDQARIVAAALLRQPIADRDRSMWVMGDSLMLLDESGGEAIESFDDATACHYFLQWLHESREQIRKRHAVQANRSTFKLVGVQPC